MVAKKAAPKKEGKKEEEKDIFINVGQYDRDQRPIDIRKGKHRSIIWTAMAGYIPSYCGGRFLHNFYVPSGGPVKKEEKAEIIKLGMLAEHIVQAVGLGESTSGCWKDLLSRLRNSTSGQRRMDMVWSFWEIDRRYMYEWGMNEEGAQHTEPVINPNSANTAAFFTGKYSDGMEDLLKKYEDRVEVYVGSNHDPFEDEGAYDDDDDDGEW